MYSHADVLTLGSYVYENFYAAPVDWLVDDYGRDVLHRYNRCLVPNLVRIFSCFFLVLLVPVESAVSIRFPPSYQKTKRA